ncbi:cytochrome c biogenesis protein ResB [bacterium]|nr:cytochrome c biogenesis protein ResB [bacterium]MBU1983367.1 cytochrome c biogenesis protein ResB [bacterium]
MNYTDYLSEPEATAPSAKKAGLWATLSSMRFAIWMLVLLGALSLVSLFIGELRGPQATPGVTNIGNALMTVFQMDDPFRSWWYRLLLGILCLSLFTCILERTPIVWRQWTKKPSADTSWLKNVRPGTVRIIRASREDLRRRLSGWSWRIKSDSLWVCERGRVGMWGPLFTHVGMLLIGIGALTGSFGGIRTRDGGFAGDVIRPPEANFAVRIDSFRVQYYPLQPGQWVLVNGEWIGKLEKQQSDGSWQVRRMTHPGDEGTLELAPATHIRNRFGSEMDRANIQRYVSYVTLLDHEEAVLRTAEIVVNSPLRHQGYRFYQSSYDPDRPRFQAAYDKIQLAVSDSLAGVFDTLTLISGEETAIPSDTLKVTAGRLLPHFKLGQTGAYSETAEFVNPAVQFTFRGPGGFEQSKWVFLRFPSHEAGPGRFNYRLATLAGERATEELMTVWEIKKTYGGWILWAGFILGTLGLFLCFYVTHRVLYVEWIGTNETKVTGLTRKTMHLYARQLDHLLEGLDKKVS